jgi:penicillin amidase
VKRFWPWAVVLVAAFAALVFAGLERGRERTAARAGFPRESGTLAVAGVSAPVQITRDARGVPHVRAQSEADAWYGLGFAHAQDRLAQMLWLVRLARGRSAEAQGPAGLPADRLARTLGLGRAADAEWASLRGPVREVLEAYARGANARIALVRGGSVGPPLAIQQLELGVEEWSPADSLAVLRLYAWSLSGSVEASLVLDDLLGHLGGVDARPFFPGRGVTRLAGAAATSTAWSDPLRRASGLAARSAGSSAWAIGGGLSQSGRPLLVADSHLEPTAPALLYLAHLRGGELDAAGATVPGVPAIWTGHSRRVAWASTHARAVVTDLYSEALEDPGEARYHDGRGWRELEVREERIAVRGAPEERLRVRSTHHGPLLDGAVPGAEKLALAWAGLRSDAAATVSALRGVAKARNAGELVEALARLTQPPLAVVYADAGGAGMQVAGWIPRRPLASELVPVPGRARWYDWDGPLPFDTLPSARIGGAREWVIAADNGLAPEGAERGEWLWRSGARASRIQAALREAAAAGPIDLERASALQTDVAEPRAEALVRAALALVADDDLGSEAGEVAELLRGWDGSAAPDSAGAAAYHAFAVALSHAIFEPALGPELLGRWLAVPQADPLAVVAEVVTAAADGGARDGWSEPERVAAAVRTALRDAWFELSSQLGASRRKWRWGRLHQIGFRPFAPVPGDLVPGPFELGGSGDTVATAEYAPAAPFDVRLASLFRFAVDAARLDRSWVALAPGQSEHPRHPHFADAIDGWLAGRLEPLDLGGEAGDGPPLVLEPAR